MKTKSRTWGDEEHLWRPEEDALHAELVFTKIVVIFLTA